MPYQAIKAKLAGKMHHCKTPSCIFNFVKTNDYYITFKAIQPKQNKWTMEDCKFFEKLVCRKSFVSTIKDIEKDELYRCDTVLLLELVDTSTDSDINIGKVLITEQIAIEK